MSKNRYIYTCGNCRVSMSYPPASAEGQLLCRDCFATLYPAPVAESAPVAEEIRLVGDDYSDPMWLDRLEFGHRSSFRRQYGSI